MSRDEVQAIIDEADENGDGKLDYAEFAHMLLNMSEECVHAAKKKASQTSKAASSLCRKSSSSKKRESFASTRSFDRQKQREDIRMQLFSQSPANAYRKENSVTDSTAPSTARHSVSPPPPQPNLPPLVAPTQEPTSIAQPLPVSTPVSSEEQAQSAVVKPEPSTPQPETSTVQETAKPENKQTEEVVNSLPDPLELARASSLTKLPPLKNVPLPPLLSPIGGTTQQNKTDNTQSDNTKPSTDKPKKEPVNSSKEGAAPKLDQPPNATSVEAIPINSYKEDAITNVNKDKPSEGKNTDSAQEPNMASKETNEERQTDHLQNGEGEEIKKTSALPISVVSLPPNKPKNIEVRQRSYIHTTLYFKCGHTWNHVFLAYTFYLPGLLLNLPVSE